MNCLKEIRYEGVKLTLKSHQGYQTLGVPVLVDNKLCYKSNIILNKIWHDGPYTLILEIDNGKRKDIGSVKLNDRVGHRYEVEFIIDKEHQELFIELDKFILCSIDSTILLVVV